MPNGACINPDLQQEFDTLTMLSAAVAATNLNNREHPVWLDHSKPYRNTPSDSDPARRNVLSAAITLIRNRSFKDFGIIASSVPSLPPVQSGHDVDARTGTVLLDQQPFYHLWVVQQGSQQGECRATDKCRSDMNGTTNSGHKDIYSKEKDCLVIKSGKSHLQSESVKLSRWESLLTLP